ncbi:MAG: M24 family metallopeptidase [Chloroflexi bacterium]|nr:M24 family metallopeptidase [Chloroflexota bacterium]
MKSDLDTLMHRHGFDVILVSGASQHNPAMVYFTGGGHISGSDLIKIRGAEAVLFHNPMERDEAVRTGLKTISYSKYPWVELVKEAGGDDLEALVLRFQKMFTDLGILSGKVAVYGFEDVGMFYSILSQLQKKMPDLVFEGFARDEVLLNARMTKDLDEIERIRQMGKITIDVVGKTADFLTGHRTRKGLLVQKNGAPLLIGDVKRKINLWLAEGGVENPWGTIFAIGRDAGVPHSCGTPCDAIRLGQTIVFDIYPCEAGGGYFYDFTRTWCLGYASDEIQNLYADVKKVYDQIYAELVVNQPFYLLQKRTCDLFEEMGHPTVKSSPVTETGYVHSLGHGIGLQVHEKPWSTMVNPSPSDILAPGSVFTLEPGLYYPEKGMGVRIEDSLLVTPQGRFEVLAEYSKELVLPMDLTN